VQVHHQRQKYFEKHDASKKKTKGLLTDEQEKRLSEAGFTWKAHNKKTWEDQYDDLKAWAEEHGHAKVPKVYPENQPLSSFVHTMRRYRMWQIEGKERAAMASTRLTPERKLLLDDVGMIWDANGSSLVSRKSIGGNEFQAESMMKEGGDREEINAECLTGQQDGLLKLEENIGQQGADEQQELLYHNVMGQQDALKLEENSGQQGPDEQHELPYQNVMVQQDALKLEENSVQQGTVEQHELPYQNVQWGTGV
jgi:hypothetical protein